MKGLLALALMAALLAIGNTAAAGPFGVNTGDPIKPDEGWSNNGYGSERRDYKGALPISFIVIQGTRDGGACGLDAHIGTRTDYQDRYFFMDYSTIRTLLLRFLK